MNSVKSNIIFLLGVFCTVFMVHTTLHAQRLTELTSIKVNGVARDVTSSETLAISEKDVLQVSFECKNGAYSEDGILRYETYLDNGIDRRVSSQTETSALFQNLSEGTYLFHVQAISPSEDWRSAPVMLRFVVSNILAKKQELTKSEHGTHIGTTSQHTTDTKASFPWLIVGVSTGVITILCVVGLILFNRRASKKVDVLSELDNIKPTSTSGETLSASSSVHNTPSTRELELLAEIEQLRARNKILEDHHNTMASNADKLKEQNVGLSDQVKRLSIVKQELEDLTRQKDELFAMMIHDIKNPAALVKNLVDLLRDYDLNSQDTHEVMDDIVATTTKIVALSQEFSKVMAMDNVQLNIEPIALNIGEIIESVSRRNSSSADKKGIKIFTDIPIDLPMAEFDPQKIEEVLDNLISNAVKFSNSGSYVFVRVKPDELCYHIEVEDKGLGLSPDDVKKAFQRGRTLTARPTAGEPSSGLGLWIVKRLIEAHNGTVTLTSELGKGSTFTVTLPYSQQVVAPSAAMYA
jgi:signal transduction histidine kinase